MSIFAAKPLGIQFAENLDFMSRSGIYWKWRGNGFSGHSFGSSLGSIHCFMGSGLHEFAHCIDFIMRGKADRIGRDGLVFRQYWEKWIDALGIFDGCPKRPDMTHCEGRVFALQAYLMNKELGFIVEQLDRDEEDSLRKNGKLSEFPIELDLHGNRQWERDHALLKKMSIEEFASKQGELEHIKWKDSDAFLSQYGYGYKSGTSYKERKIRWKECFSQFIIDEYERLDNPFVERRISRAITELGDRLRRSHRARGYVPGDDVIGVRHSGIDYSLAGKNILLSKK